MRALFRFILGLFGLLGRALDLLGRSLLYLILLLVIGFVVSLLLQPAPEVPRGAALVLRPSGALVEQTVFDEPLALLRSGGVPAGQAVLGELLEAVNAARSDERIAALVIETDDLEAGGLSKLAELREAIAAFGASGKPVFARGERFTQGQYYLASAADEVHLAPDGFLLLRGLARYGAYYKQALDSLGIKVHVFRVGEYKSFAEPFTRNDMSEEDREATRDLLDGLWDRVRTDIAAARKLAPEALDRYVVGYGEALAAAQGDAAQAALDAGLVDRFSTRDQWRARLVERVGAAADGKDFRQIAAGDYLATIQAERRPMADAVAVLVAQGSIMDGKQPAGVVGGDSFVKLIREAREDDAVKAIVVRIDSPGGSAWASELIRRELELVRQAGKPVIASMSSVAASGGYWIATGASEIWAAPTTLTGSIGIFARFPEFADPLGRLGIAVDGVATAPLAGALDPRRPLDPAAAEALQLGIEHGYRRFLDTVARAREMSAGEVDEVARGRVWTGASAAELGLVDHLGGLDAAVAAAARAAGLSAYEVRRPQAMMSLQQLLLQRLLGSSVAGLLPAPASRPAPLAAMVAGLQTAAGELLKWNDPRHLYAHCLCEAP